MLKSSQINLITYRSTKNEKAYYTFVDAGFLLGGAGEHLPLLASPLGLFSIVNQFMYVK